MEQLLLFTWLDSIYLIIYIEVVYVVGYARRMRADMDCNLIFRVVTLLLLCVSSMVAIDALGELDDALGEMAETLKGYAGNEMVETQCRVINENCVDNVVLTTYRTLADNAQKLYQSIVKIKN